MGPAMSETPLRLGWTPTEALADQLSGEPGLARSEPLAGNLSTPISLFSRFERQCDLPSHPLERSPGRRDSPRRRDLIIGGDQRHHVGLATPTAGSYGRRAGGSGWIGRRTSAARSFRALLPGSLAREFLADEVPFKAIKTRDGVGC